MVDKRRLAKELRKLKKKIHSDPQVRDMYDIDGDGRISGEEWDIARQAVIAQLQAEDARQAADPKSLSQLVGAEKLAATSSLVASDRVFDRISQQAKGTSELSDGHPLLQPQLVVRQKETGVEMVFNLELANTYRIMTTSGQEVAHAAETETSLLGSIQRNFLGNFRPFTMGIRLHGTTDDLWLKRRFRLLWSHLDVAEGPDPIGEVKQRFALLKRRYELVSFYGGRRLEIIGPVFKPWTFKVMDNLNEVARIEKKWSGLFREALTREDNFLISFKDPGITLIERKLILAASISIDMDHFEQRRN